MASRAPPGRVPASLPLPPPWALPQQSCSGRTGGPGTGPQPGGTGRGAKPNPGPESSWPTSAVDAEPEGEEVYGEERDPGMCKHTCLGKEDTLPHLVSDSPVTLRNRFWAQFSQGPHTVTQSHSLSLGTLKSEEQGCRVDR